MCVFHFRICRDGRRAEAGTSGDFADCGMDFRAARAMIARIRAEENLPEHALGGMLLKVTYDDGSELFSLPFDLGI